MTLAAVVLALAVAPAHAATTVKMATLVPDGSIWDKALEQMGSEWREATGGQVVLRIYGGGVAGDEPDVVRKMRIGQLHAAALTTAGLSTLDEAFEIFEIPMFFESYDELFHALAAVRPALEARLYDRGWVLLNWGHGGWVHLFSTKPVRVVGDLKALKLFSWSGDDAMLQLWRKNGFQPVPLAATDILTGLQTGMIEALPTTPLAALSLQWFRQTPYMQDIGFAPLVGATVISRAVWEKIPEADRAKLRAAAAETERTLEREVPDQDARAVEQMRARGLTVVETDDATRAAWKAFADEVVAGQLPALETPELLEALRKARDAHRAKAAGGGSPP